jgi:CheY-like chemotaxis protein
MLPILIVDDYPDLCTMMIRLLERCGHEATAVEDGAAALRFVRDTPPAMVLLDLMMPDMTGFDVLRAMRADPRTRDVPVVMYTAMDDANLRRQAMEMGAQDYLVKARSSFDEFVAVVDRYAGEGTEPRHAAQPTRPAPDQNHA